MNDQDKGQVISSAAQIYEEFFTPALFQEWTSRVADAAQIKPSQAVLDVACGTGILARTAIKYVGESGTVIGLDINEGMLSVARSKSTDIEWKQGVAESLPFEDASFDAVISQFGLMFFENRATAINEMIRVLRPEGKLAVAVWGALEDTPGYFAMVKLLQRLFGDEIANGLRAPYNLSDVEILQQLFQHKGLKDVTIETHDGLARFPSLESWMYTDIKGWTLADAIDDAQYEMLLNEAKKVLAQFVGADGHVSFKAPAHIVSGTKA